MAPGKVLVELLPIDFGLAANLGNRPSLIAQVPEIGCEIGKWGWFVFAGFHRSTLFDAIGASFCVINLGPAQLKCKRFS